MTDDDAFVRAVMARPGDDLPRLVYADRLDERNDRIEQLRGRPGAVVRCREAHDAYRAEPGVERREALRRAYEAVPEHLRLYCGDMDSNDGPIRRILSGGPFVVRRCGERRV